MKKIVSNTLVRNGQPYIGKVLEQVIPFMYKCVVTLSVKSDDGTRKIIEDLMLKYPEKIDLEFEGVVNYGDLTEERNKMVARSKDADWLVILDDDDLWPTESLKSLVSLVELDEDVDGYNMKPFQVVDMENHDGNWSSRYFTKWQKNIDINYKGAWPKDLVYTGDTHLYWRHNSRVITVPHRFFHLSYLKSSSFREAGELDPMYNHKPPTKVKFTKEERKVLHGLLGNN